MKVMNSNTLYNKDEIENILRKNLHKKEYNENIKLMDYFNNDIDYISFLSLLEEEFNLSFEGNFTKIKNFKLSQLIEFIYQKVK